MKEKLHIIPHKHEVDRNSRERLNAHKAATLWFTGLSGSGKSTLANEVEKGLNLKGIRTFILDGDNVRSGLNKDLDFSEQGRIENIRRIAEVAKLMNDAGLVVLTAFISPFEKEREMARSIIGENTLIQVFVDCPIEICEQRDVKGLYKRARNGEISHFTGIDSPFELPANPDIRVSTHLQDVDACAKQVVNYLLPRIQIHE